MKQRVKVRTKQTNEKASLKKKKKEKKPSEQGKEMRDMKANKIIEEIKLSDYQ
jgi:hypothetical protein